MFVNKPVAKCVWVMLLYTGFLSQTVGECWWWCLVVHNTVITNTTCMVFSHITLHKICGELPTLLTTKHTADQKQTQNEARSKQQFPPKTSSASLNPHFSTNNLGHLQSKFGSYLNKTPHNTSPKHNWPINSKQNHKDLCLAEKSNADNKLCHNQVFCRKTQFERWTCKKPQSCQLLVNTSKKWRLRSK
jgi:hypothetical protein